MAFALSTYTPVFAQITRLVTGSAPADPAFVAQWMGFLRQRGRRLAEPVGAPDAGPPLADAALAGPAQDGAGP
jgi:hypothetical protein